MAQTVTIRAKGLYLTGSDFSAPDGAMSQADDVVISRDGIVETRRGLDVRVTKALARLFPFKGAIVGHDGTSTLSYSSDSGATWADYGASVTAPSGHPVRAVEAASSLFVTDQVRPKRIDALAGTPEEAGVPGALDVELTLSSAGSPTAMPTASQVGYRVVFGKKDANGRLLLGMPSSRTVVANTSGGVRDVTVGFSLPTGLDSSHFFQGYRTTASVSGTTDPGDEMGLIYEGAVPQTRTISSLVRATNVVTATTTEAHGYSTGTIVRVTPGGAVGGAHVVALTGSAGGAVRSEDSGATWSGSGISGYGGFVRQVASKGDLYMAVGASGYGFSSPDGLTWTGRTLPGSASYSGVTWASPRWVAVGISGAAAYASDVASWSSTSIPAGDWYGVATDGSVVAAAGERYVGGATAYEGQIASSPDGATAYTLKATIPGFRFRAILRTGARWIAAGYAAAGSWGRIYHSTDLVTWTLASGVGSSAPLLMSLADSGSAVVAIGFSGAGFVSEDGGLTWAPIATGVPSARAVTWAGDAFVVVGYNACATAPASGASWTARTIPAGEYLAVATGGSAVFLPGEKTVTGVPLATTFTYAETGTDGTLTQTQAATPMTGAFLDTVPDGFLGAALYTNENQQGILAANDRPPLSREVASFAGSVFYANVTLPATATAYLLAVGGANGLAVNDTITINGVVYTGKSAESVAAREFKVTTSGTLAANIQDTALSLIRVVNRSLSSGATVTHLSGPDDPPGQLEFRNTAPAGALSVTFSKSTAFSPTSISEEPNTHANGLVWSKTDEPDHVARSLTLSPVLIGSADKAILRVIPTRSAAFVLKEDGIWRITGAAGQFDVQPFDPTIRVVGAETAVPLDNTIFALSEQGVVRISDTGVAVVSRPIESAILPLIASAMRSTTALRAFSVGYESDRKLILWLPTEVADTKATQAFVYDMFTNAWTRRTDDFAHVIVNPADDRLYGVDGTSVWQERKALDDTDLADRSYAVTISSGGGTASVVLADATNAAVGDAIAQGAVFAIVTAKNSNTLTLDRAAALTNAAATIHKAIPTAVKWSPKFGASPARLSELQEVAIFWDRVYFAAASLTFSTNLVPSTASLPLSGADYGWTAPVAQTEVRVWPPAEACWGSQFNVGIVHQQAWSPNAIAGLVVTAVSPSTVINR